MRPLIRPALQADNLNREASRASLYMNNPIRKKAWHRALKGGRLWVIVSPEIQDAHFPHVFAKRIVSPYVQNRVAYITWPLDLSFSICPPASSRVEVPD